MSDRCAQCFQQLKAAPSGGRYVCWHPTNFRAGLKGCYLTEAIPEPPHTMEACITSRENRPTLHLYGSAKL